MIEISAFSLLALFGVTIVVGYLGSLIFEKTKISDIIWLLLFGILIGPVFNLVDRGLFIAISPFIASLALLIILFDAGLNINFYQLVRGAPRGMLLAVLGFIIGVASVGGMAFYLFKFNLLTSLLLGSIVGGTSSPIVLSIISKIKMNNRAKTMLTLESVFTDPLVIIVSIALINIAIGTSIVSPIQSILSSFSIGAVIGLILGIVWLFALDVLKGKPFDYMMTLAILFLIYIGVEQTGGSGAIAALAFGLVLGNGGAFSRMLKLKKRFSIDYVMKTFQFEVTFFIRSFFFVYLGIIAIFNQAFLLYGILVAVVAVIIRIVVVEISTIGMRLSEHDRNIMSVVGPRGLAAAVLAQLTVNFGLPHAYMISNIVFVVIIASVLYTSFTTMILTRKRTKRNVKKRKH
ncbi:MAG: cation:proton antiporter [Candidatus Aenigmatarchaeota archaeon]